MTDDVDENEYVVETDLSGLGVDQGTFTGEKANQAALKLARRLPKADSEAAARENATEVTIRNAESDAEFVFDAWAWQEESGDDADDWMPDAVTEVDLEPTSLDDPEEWFAFEYQVEEWNANR